MRKEKRKSLFDRLGPGFITGASDDDPSGIATYTQTGAQFGFHQLWTSLFSIPFMIVVQEMCGRIGLVTGKGLAGNIRKHYGRTLLFFCISILFLANTVNIGADLGAMAAAATLVIPVPFEVMLLGMTAITLLLEVFVSYRVYAKFLKYLTFSLFAYVVTAFIIAEPWGEIAYRTFLPHVTWSKEYAMNIAAILGTTISPYLFFWQAGEEVEEEVSRKILKAMGIGKPHISGTDVSDMRQDTAIGMIFSNIVMFFIMVVGASTLGAHGIHHIETAAQAAEAMRPLAGNFAFVLFALGIVGTGLLAVPVLAGSASYALAEAFRWKEGLYLKFNEAHGFYGAITIATLVGLMTNFAHVPPFTMLYYTAILNGIVAPPLLVIILLIANNKKIMGKWKNGRLSNVIGWTIVGVMTCTAVAVLSSLMQP